MKENEFLKKDEGIAIHSQSEVRSYNLCTHLRALSDLDIHSVKNTAFDNAIIAKDIIKMFINGECDISEIDELVDEGICDDYETTLTGKKRKETLIKVLKRYCRSEKRKLITPEAKIINIENTLFRVKPDAIYDDGKTIEGIVYRNCLPDVTQTGKKRDKSVEKCTELYLINEYLKGLVPYGETRTLKASYYFLHKHGDNQQWSNDFFDGAGRNIVTLEDVYTSGQNIKTANDLELINQINEWEVGRECSGEDCKNCMLFLLCNYVGSPVHLEKKNGASVKVIPTEAQSKVINFTEGIARVVAGAGAGKTECVVQRVVKLIENMVASGLTIKQACNTILMITFTEAGCKEMRQRVRRRLEEHNIFIDAEDLKIATFNQFAYQIVKEHYEDVGFKKEPVVIDDVRKSVIVTQLLDEHVISNLDYLHFTIDEKNIKGALICAIAVFDKIKELRVDPLATDTPDKVKRALSENGMYRFLDDIAISQLCMLFDEYQKRLIEDNLITFADQEPMMLEIIDKHPDLIDSLGFAHIIVDEFQDSNDIQMHIIKKLTTGKDFKSLMVVGDDSQSIFGFRNTTPENILHFFEKMDVKDGIDLRLVDNHRSTPEILDLANKINGLNKNRIDKDLVSTRDHGEKPIVKGFHNKPDEYDYIANEIKRLIDEKGYEPEDFAFISFTNAELVKMGAKLSSLGIPWVMMNPTVLMSNAKVVAAISLATAFWQPESTSLYFNYLTVLYDGKILELPREEINAKIKELKIMFENMDQHPIPVQRQLFHDMLEKLKKPIIIGKDADENDKDNETGIDEIYEYFLELIYQCPDLPSELQYISDFKKYGTKVAKRMEQSYQGVVLTTAHSSKGLEWKVVFNSLTNYDNPYLHNPNHEDAVEERRRLLFVSLTRARDLLYVTGQYVAYGDADNKTYNQFLREVFEQNGDKYDPVDPMAAIKAAERRAKAAEAARRRREKVRDIWASYTKKLPGQLTLNLK